VAIVTCGLVLLQDLLLKWFFPHYYAPVACLVLYLQVYGLRQIWEWSPQVASNVRNAPNSLRRADRRRLKKNQRLPEYSKAPLRGLVYLLPVVCLVLLGFRLEDRLEGRKLDSHGPDRQALLMNDWSLERARLEKWLEEQPKPQLVFVRYSPRHNINYEWVYNHPNIMHSHVIWARDLGAEHNKLLLNLVSDRKIWLIEPDTRDYELIPYNEAIGRPTVPKSGEWENIQQESVE
jgi:hypothetical protein